MPAGRLLTVFVLEQDLISNVMRRANAPVRAMATVSHKGGGDKTFRENWSWALDFGMVRNQPRIMGPSGRDQPVQSSQGPPTAGRARTDPIRELEVLALGGATPS